MKLFRTRLVLQTPDVPASVRLLGRPGAEDLDRIGQAIPYLDGEVLTRVRGFRVPPLFVQDLVARMGAQVAAEAWPALFEQIGQATPQAALEDPKPAAEDDSRLNANLPSEVPVHPTGTSDAAGPEPADTYEQAPLVRVVSMPELRSPGIAPVPTSATAWPPLTTAEFLGHDRILVNGSELTAAEGVPRDLFPIVACLPPDKASFARVAALMYPSDADVDQKMTIQRVRQNKSNLQKRGRVVPQEQARHLLTLQNGVLAVNEELDAVDVQAFLGGMQRAHRARAVRIDRRERHCLWPRTRARRRPTPRRP